MPTRFADHLIEGDHASRPAATAVPVGTLYACSDHDIIYQGDGAAWATWYSVTATAPAFHGVNVLRTADKSINNNAETVLDLDSERFDTDGYHDNVTNNSRLTVPSGLAGKYLITLSTNWASSQTSGVREGRITLNATPTYLVLDTSDVDTADSHRNSMSCIRALAVGDYVEARVFQKNDASAAVQLLCSNIFEFSMVLLGT